MRALLRIILPGVAAALVAAGPADPLAAGKQAFESGDYAAAVNQLQRVANPAHVCEASFYTGLSLYRLKQTDDAIVALESAAKCAGSPQAGLALGQAYLEKGDDNRAAAAFENALKREPSNRDALRALSSLFLRHELNDKAIPLLQRLAESGLPDAQILADLGAAYAGITDLPKARIEFEKALAAKPGFLPAMVGLANVRIKSGDNDQALPLLDRAIAAGSASYEPYFLRAIVHAKAGRNPQAAADLEKSVSLGGNDPEIYYHQSRVYRALGHTQQSQEALARFKAARGSTEGQAEASRRAARAMQEAKRLVQTGDLAGAATLLEQAESGGVRDAQLEYRLASLYLDLQRLQPAAERARTAVELAPGEWSYRYLLGVIELKLGRGQQAQQHLETAVRLNPAAADAWNALGDVAMRSRAYGEAARSFEEAVRLKPGEAAYRLNLETARRLAP